MPRPKSAKENAKTLKTATPVSNSAGNASRGVSAVPETKAPQETNPAAAPGPVAVPTQLSNSDQKNSQRQNVKQQTAGGPQITDEQIRERAYHLFLERGGNGGDPQEDWFRAETELRRRSA